MQQADSNIILQFIQEARNNGILINKQIKNLVQLVNDMGYKDVELKQMREVTEFSYIYKRPDKTLRFYREQFQSHLLPQIAKFYQEEMDNKLNVTTTEYINWANSIFQLELNMCQECYPMSYSAVQDILTQMLVKNQVARLVDSHTGLSQMLLNDRTDELKQLFQFIIRINKSVFLIAKYLNKKDSFNKSNNRIAVNNLIIIISCFLDQAEIYYNRIFELMQKVENVFNDQLEVDQEFFKSYGQALTLLTNQHEESSKWLLISSQRNIKKIMIQKLKKEQAKLFFSFKNLIKKMNSLNIINNSYPLDQVINIHKISNWKSKYWKNSKGMFISIQQ